MNDHGHEHGHTQELKVELSGNIGVFGEVKHTVELVLPPGLQDQVNRIEAKIDALDVHLDQIEKKIDDCCQPSEAVKLIVEIGQATEQPNLEGEEIAMSFSTSLTATQQRTITVSGAVDKKGNPAPLDGLPAFASADETVCTFTTDPSDASGMTGLLVAVGPLATAAAVSITADADLGAGVVNIVENGLVEISAGQAVGFNVTVGDPVEQP